MTEGTIRQLRVLHIVSSGGIAAALQPSLFVPLLTRLPKQRVKAQVVSLAPNCVRAAMLRQHGVPVHDIALSRHNFSVSAVREVRKAAQKFRPDIIQAWGHTAQIVSIAVRKRCEWKPHVVWSVADTVPLPKKPGFIDRQKLSIAIKRSAHADRIVYTSEAGAAHHRRVGFPDGGHECIAPGVDAVRFKPDPAARKKVRDNLQLPSNAFVVGMAAPFQPEYDHATFLKGIGELIKTNPHLYVLLAGHGVQRGNGPLMGMVGGGTLGTRTQLLGEWSDLATLFNACDLVCSSALTDSARMTLATAMLCGVPCVATGMGAQGELIGQHGVAVEPGSPAAFIRGIGKILEMPTDKRMQLAHGARKYALQNFVYVRSLQKYLKLYCDLVGREAQVAEAVPLPVPDPEPSAPITRPVEPEPVVLKDHAATIAELTDPDSLEARVAPQEPEALPKWRIEQEQERAKQEALLTASAASRDGDVLQLFEMEIAKPGIASVTPMGERARGYVEDFEELLSPEVLTAPAAVEAPVPSPTTEAELDPQADAAKATPESPKIERQPQSIEIPPPSAASGHTEVKRASEVEEAQAPKNERATDERRLPKTTPPAVPSPQSVEAPASRQATSMPAAVAQAGDSAGATEVHATSDVQKTPAAPEPKAASASEDPGSKGPASEKEASKEAAAKEAGASVPASPSPPASAATEASGAMESEPEQQSLFDFEPEKKAIG